MGLRDYATDFVNGAAVTVGSSWWARRWLRRWFPRRACLPALDEAVKCRAEKDPSYYPPERQGMRGNHEGTYTYAHKLRDGDFWEGRGKPQTTGENNDLVIVGGGISGLAAAYFFRQHAGSKATILIVDIHGRFLAGTPSATNSAG